MTAADPTDDVRPGTPLARRVLAGYALGSLVTGAFGTVPGLLLLPYLTDTLGVAAGVAGLLVLLPKAWDVLVNPVAGRLSDRRGDRRPFLLVAGLALGVLFAAMFAGPLGSGAGAGAYVAMPAELTDGYAERTRMMTWRVAVLALAILVSGALAPLIVEQTGGGLTGHRWAGAAVGAFIVVGTLGTFFGTRTAPSRTPAATEPTLRMQLAIVASNVPFRALLACFVVQSAGIGTMLAGVQYFADHVLVRTSGATLLFAAFVGPALLVMPVWIRAGDPPRQAALARRRLGAVRHRRAGVAVRSDAAAGRRLPDRRGGRLRVRRPAGVRPGHAAGLHRPRHPAHRPPPGRRVHRAVDRGGDPRAGAGPGHLRAGAPDVRLRLVVHRRGRGSGRHRPARRAAGIRPGPGHPGRLSGAVPAAIRRCS
jgi:MFS family permease